MAEASSWLIVGLGNPGPKYANNRHNVGFMVAERFVDRFGTTTAGDVWREKFNGKFASVSPNAERCFVLQPQTFMNCSGQSVAAASSFFRVPAPNTIVVHDELDFEFGRVAIKKGGGHGGHNGLRDIISATGSRDFLRIRTGIGRPPKGSSMDVSSWVLKDFGGDDRAELPELVDRAVEAALAILTDGVGPAMNRFNQTAATSREAPPPSPDAESP